VTEFYTGEYFTDKVQNRSRFAACGLLTL